MLRVLIVDDEKLARQRIEDLLAKQSGVQVVGSAANGEAALEEIRELDPDLVFLDVQMPGKTGLDVLNEIGPDAMPPTIFVTAYDQYAVRAFEAAAIDYLLKPFDDERFEQAFQRARRLIELEEIGRLSGRLRALLAGGATTPAPPAAAIEYTDRFAVETRGHVLVVPVDELDYISAAGPYAELHAGKQKHLLRERMQNLEQRLDPRLFLRIHRSTIVRIDRIESLHKAAGGDYSVKLKNGMTLDVSRTRVTELSQRLGVT